MLYLCSIIISVALFVLMIYLLWLNNRDGSPEYWNMQLIALLLGSLYLIYKVIVSFWNIRPYKRSDLILIDSTTNPELFKLIEEVVTYMQIAPPQKVYISSSTSASVFVDTNILSLFLPHKRSKSLEIGLGIINTMNYDELRAIIAHEMAHYSQRAIQLGTPVYILAKSVRRMKEGVNLKRGIWDRSYYALNDIFGIIVVLVFDRVLKKYKELSDELEFDADRIAAEYVGSEILVSALYKASFTHHTFSTLMQSVTILADAKRGVENIYAAQRAINSAVIGSEWGYMPTTELLSSDRVSRIVKLRIELLQSENLKTTLATNYNPARKMLFRYESECRDMSRLIYSELYKMEVTQDNALSIPIYTLWIKNMLEQKAQQGMTLTKSVVNVEVKMQGAMHFAPIVDIKFKILWDGKKIGMGSFRKNFSHIFTSQPGKHKLTFEVYNTNQDVLEVEISTEVKNVVFTLDYKVNYRKGEYNFFIISSKELNR